MSVILRVDTGPLKSFLEAEPQRMQEALRMFTDEGSILAMQELRSNVPIRSGFLRESVTRQILPGGFTVYPTAPYAEFVDQGTGPHMIFPRSGKVLAFVNQWGATVFAKHIHHPGSHGRFFIARSAENLRFRLTDLWYSILERLHR